MILGTYGRVLRGNETVIGCFILEEKSVCCADFITRREKKERPMLQCNNFAFMCWSDTG